MNADSKVQYLSIDPAFGILTRPALELKLSSMPDERIARIFVLDLNDIHKLNNVIGYEAVNRTIRAVLSTIGGKFPSIIIGRVFSGDEIAMIDEGQTYFDIEHGVVPYFEAESMSFKYVYHESNFGMTPAAYSAIFTELSERLRTRKFYQII